MSGGCMENIFAYAYVLILSRLEQVGLVHRSSNDRERNFGRNLWVGYSITVKPIRQS